MPEYVSENIEMIEMHEAMQYALNLARKCREHGDVPVGAVILRGSEIVGTGRNRVEQNGNPLAHAEIEAIDEAVRRTGHKHLLGCRMFVTLEPCSMCAGAIVLSRIDALIIAADDPKTGACGSLTNIPEDSRLNHRTKITRGILTEESSRLLKNFFAELRKTKNVRI